MGEGDLPKLQPLLLLEVTALLDSGNVIFRKRKPPRRKRKVGKYYLVYNFKNRSQYGLVNN